MSKSSWNLQLSPWPCLYLLCMLLMITGFSSSVLEKVHSVPSNLNQTNTTQGACPTGCDVSNFSKDAAVEDFPKANSSDEATDPPGTESDPTDSSVTVSQSAVSVKLTNTTFGGEEGRLPPFINSSSVEHTSVPFNLTTSASSTPTSHVSTQASVSEQQTVTEPGAAPPSTTAQLQSSTLHRATTTATAEPVRSGHPVTAHGTSPSTHAAIATVTPPSPTTGGSAGSAPSLSPPSGTTTPSTGGTSLKAAHSPVTPSQNTQPFAPATKVSMVEVEGAVLTRQLVDTASLLAVLLFGLFFFLVIVAMFVIQAYESYRRKDYTQVDYLINGMYTDSGV